MAYGLSVTGANDSFIIDSNTTQTEYLSVISSGQVSGTTNSRATITATAPDLVWMNAHEVSSGGQYQLRNGYNTTAATTNYIVTRKTASLSSFSGNYGLQVYNESDVKIFDSRGITEGVNIIDVKTEGTVGGARITSGQVTLEHTYEGDDLSTIVYEGDPTGVYVTTIGSSFSNYGAQYYMQYYFDYTNNYIIHMNYIDIVETGLNIWPNWSMILVGKLQT